MILAISPEGGFWWTLNALRNYRGDGAQPEQGGSKAGEETEEDRKAPDLPEVRERDRQRPKDSASSREILMILKALVCTA